jgi:hypothetical protein
MSPCTKTLGTNITKRDMSQKLRKMEEKQGHIQALKVKFCKVQLILPRKQNL